MAPKSVRERTVRRAVLLTPDEEILLIRIREPGTGWTAWITPGGGARPGEEPVDTLRRELFEETGLRDFECGPLLWNRDHTTTWEGRRIRQIEAFYLIRHPRFPPTLAHQPAAIELRAFRGFRWWKVADIEASEDTFVPLRLAEYVRCVIENGPPAEPFDAGE